MKNNTKYSFSIISPSEALPTAKEVEVNSKEYVLFGEDNRYSNHLLECYDKCSILTSIINSMTDYVSGMGIDNDKEINRNNEMLSELVKKITLDYIVFGAFTVQAIRNKLGNICELNYVDVNKCRLSKDEKYVFYSPKGWDKYTRNVQKYDRYDFHIKSNNSIFYCKNTKSNRTLYGLPIWNSCIKEIRTLMEIVNFHYSSIINNFMPSAIISFNNGVPTEDEQEQIEERITAKFCGSDNASRFLLSFSDNKDNAPAIERLAYDDFADRYNTLKDSCINNIYATFKASEKLFGINETNNGFSTEEFQSIFLLFKQQVIKPMQIEIEKAFKKLGFNFTLNEYMIDFEDTDATENNEHNTGDIVNE